MRSLLKSSLVAAATIGLLAATAGADSFTPGDLAVVRIGDGSAVLTSTSTATFLDEYTTAGVQVAGATVSVSTAGVNPLTNSGTATSEGALSLSANGQYLVLAGYNTAAGATTGVASSTVLRDVALVSASGGVNTSTTFSTFSGNNIRGATSLDGTQVYAVGATGGVQYATTGSSTSTQISSTVTNLRTIQILNGQLFESTGSGSTRGVYAVGTGVPTAGPQTATSVALDPAGASPAGANSSPYAFVILGNNLYLADSNSLANGGGLEKFASNGSGGFTYEYTIVGGITQGLDGLTGASVNGINTLYATTADGTLLVGTTDLASATTLPGSDTFTTLATAKSNEVFRGVSFTPTFGPSAVPEPASLILLGMGGLGARWVLRRRKPASA